MERASDGEKKGLSVGVRLWGGEGARDGRIEGRREREERRESNRKKVQGLRTRNKHESRQVFFFLKQALLPTFCLVSFVCF